MVTILKLKMEQETQLIRNSINFNNLGIRQ